MEVIILAIVPCVYGSVMHAHHVRELIIKKIVKHRHSIADGNAEGETLLFIEIRHIRNVTVWEDIYAIRVFAEKGQEYCEILVTENNPFLRSQFMLQHIAKMHLPVCS